jgi:hypothetical protein
MAHDLQAMGNRLIVLTIHAVGLPLSRRLYNDYTPRR